jgi:hypothetical protein
MQWTRAHNPIVPNEARPDWLQYPQELLELVASGRMPLVPWCFVTGESAEGDYRRFRSHLRRELVPFAFRQDREDLAWFEKGKGHEVFIIHDNTDPG